MLSLASNQPYTASIQGGGDMGSRTSGAPSVLRNFGFRFTGLGISVQS